MKEYRQFGVCIPRGVEATVHFRDIVEFAAQSGAIGPLVVMDVDMANCFCTLEWDEMRKDVADVTPSALPWIAWQQQQPGEVVLPCGE